MEARKGPLQRGSELAVSTASDLGPGRQLGLDSCSWPPPLRGLQRSPRSRLTSSLLRALLLPTQALPMPGPGGSCGCECGWGPVGRWDGEILGTRCARGTQPCGVHPPGRLAQLSFPEPPRCWRPRQADSRRMGLLRPPRAQAASSRPPRALGQAGQASSPGNSAGCFFFSPSSSKLHSASQ